MSVKPDHWIEKMAREQKMIDPFAAAQVKKDTISFGLSAYGYDMRLHNEFKVFTGLPDLILDPKAISPDAFKVHQGDTCLIPPNIFILARSVEFFRIPRNVVTLTSGKSTYARCGVIVNVTPFEPEWQGYVTISISNTASVPARVHAGEGIAQVLFFESDQECRISYADKKGRYQNQQNIKTATL